MNIGQELYIGSEIYQISDKEQLICDIHEQTTTLFLVPDVEEDRYDIAYNVLINNIAGALKLEKDQYKIVSLTNPTSFKNILIDNTLKYFIVFGEASNLVENQFQYSKNQYITINNSKFIFTDALGLINNPSNKAQKNEFWLGLQKMFHQK
jgi:hypothetical protein